MACYYWGFRTHMYTCSMCCYCTVCPGPLWRPTVGPSTAMPVIRGSLITKAMDPHKHYHVSYLVWTLAVPQCIRLMLGMPGMLFWQLILTTMPTASGGKSYGGADACPRCGGRVYAAEKIVGAGSVCYTHTRTLTHIWTYCYHYHCSSIQSWHKACFNCAECNKKLDSTTMSDNEGQIYCKGNHTLI